MAEYKVDLPSGESYSVKADSDEAAQAAINDLLGQTKASGLEAFGRAAVNNLPLGGQIGALGTLATDPSQPGYSEALESWNKKAGEAKSEHPVAYGAGAVTGAVAPALIPGAGELGMAGNMALGAGYGMGNVDVMKHPEEALKQGVAGAGIGAITHGLAEHFMPEKAGLEEYANKKGVQALNLRPGTLGVSDEELSDLGRLAHETGLLEGSTQERAQKAGDLLHQVGSQIGDIGGGARPVTNIAPFMDDLQSQAEESAKFFGTEGNQDLNMYRQGMANLQNNGKTFDELQALKNAYGEKAFNDVGEVVNPAAAKVYGTIRDAMKSVISDSPTEYQDLMSTYGTLKDIHGGLTRQLQQEQAKGAQSRGFGMVGKLAGMLGQHPTANVAAAAALAPMHPFMALGALTPIATNPQALSNMARSAASAIPAVTSAAETGTMDAVTSKLFNTLQTNPQSLGKFANPLLQAAKTGGSRGIAATHFLLSHQYPEYNELAMHGLEHKAIEKSNENIGGEE